MIDLRHAEVGEGDRVGAFALGGVVEAADADDERPGRASGAAPTAAVPIVPGLVRLTVVPAKSSGLSLLERTLRISSS